MKNHLRLLAVLLLLITAPRAFAQPICGADRILGRRMTEDSNYRKTVQAADLRIQEFIELHKPAPGARVAAISYTIPVVIHVVHTGGAVGTTYNPTDAQINGALNYLNQIYNGTYAGIEGVGDIQIQFVLATRDPNCNPTTGIDRVDGSSLTNYSANGVNSGATGTGVHDTILKNFVRWDPANYYNIWVVNKIDGKDGTSGQFIAGYAYFAQFTNATVDGTVMLATQMIAGQKTLPHEIGHALGLYHTFQGSPDYTTCPANANCNIDGDQVCDTDPITQNLNGTVYDFSCRSGINSCTGTAYAINTEKNFMNYTNCYTLFTAGQKARMQAAMSLQVRASLATSVAKGSYPVAPFTSPSASCAPATGSAGLAANIAGTLNVTVNGRTFNSSTSRIDGGYVDNTGNCLKIIELQKNASYAISATLLCANDEQLSIWIDYNNSGVLDPGERVLFVPNVPSGSGPLTVSSTITIPATATTGTMLRLRVMDEVSAATFGSGYTVTSGCYNPVYGQAEDYPVFLTAATLPVKFDYFNGVRKNSDAVLSWKTSIEQNAKEFAVERSTDGSQFTQIGTVPASNNATGAAYSFTDKNVSAVVNYYRLRQVDQNLQSTLSQVAIVRFDNDAKKSMRMLNNPFNAAFGIVFTGTSSATSRLHVLDVMGRVVWSKDVKTVSGQPLQIDLSQLLPGTYILRAQTGDAVFTEKIIKQ